MLLATIHSHLMLSVPLQYRQCSNLTSILVQFSGVWLLPVLLATPSIVLYATDTFDLERQHWGCGPLNIQYVLSTILPMFYMPLLLIIVAYIKVTTKVKQQNRIAIKLLNEVSVETLANGSAQHEKAYPEASASTCTTGQHTSQKDKAQVMVETITNDNTKDITELLSKTKTAVSCNDHTVINSADSLVSTPSSEISGSSLTTFNMSQVGDDHCAFNMSAMGDEDATFRMSAMADDDPECYSIGSLVSSDGVLNTSPHIDSISTTVVETFNDNQADNHNQHDISLSTDTNKENTDQHQVIDDINKEAQILPDSHEATDTNKENIILPDQHEENAKDGTNEKESTIVHVKAKAGKEQLNAPVDNRDVHIIVDTAGLLDTDKLLQGLDNPAYDLTEENPLAESIKPKKVKRSGSKEGSDGGDEKTSSQGSTAQHSRDSSLGAFGIDGPRRSILRRNSSKRASHKNVKFNLPEGETKVKKNYRLQRKPTGIRRDRKGNKNHISKQKLRRISSAGQTVDNHITNGQIANAKIQALHHNGSVKSSAFEYMAQVQRNQGLRLSSKVRSHKAHVQLLCVMFGTFVLVSLPYFVAYTVLSACPSCREGTKLMMIILEWLFHAASTVNLFIYVTCCTEFRTAFLVMFGCK